MAVDVKEDAKAVTFVADVPGLKQENLKVCIARLPELGPMSPCRLAVSCGQKAAEKSHGIIFAVACASSNKLFSHV